MIPVHILIYQITSLKPITVSLYVAPGICIALKPSWVDGECIFRKCLFPHGCTCMACGTPVPEHGKTTKSVNREP